MTTTTTRRYCRLHALLLSVGFLALWSAHALGAGGTLTIIPHADLKNTDPIWTTAYITRNHGYMIYDTLFSLDDTFQPQPQMVDTWNVSADGLKYTFTLRTGLKWHDGAPVRAADCVASIKRWGKRDGMGQKLTDLTASLDVVDDRTFTLTLKEPYGLVLQSLGKLSSNVPFMMPERVAQTDAFTQIKENIGSGPFKFVQDAWVPGSKVVYVRNPDYVPRAEPPSYAAGGKKVLVERVEWRYIPDPSTAQAALAAGEVDYYETPPVDLLPLMEKNADITVAIIDPLGTQGWIRPNHLHPPFNHPKARQALLWMVKQEDYLRAVIGDPKFWRTCGAYFMCGAPFETDVGSEPLMKQDFNRAQQLMKEAGYNGEPVVLMDPTDIPILHNASLVTAQLLKKIGVNVQVQAMDWSTLTSRRAEKKPPAEGGWHLFHTYATGADVSTPIINNGIIGGCEEKAWFGWPCSAEIEKLRDTWARATELTKQKEITVELQRLLYEVVPYVNFGQWSFPTAYRKSLKGVIVSPVPFFWNITKEG